MMDAGTPSNVIDFSARYAAAQERRRAQIAEDRARKKSLRARKPRQMPEGLDESAQRKWRLSEDLRIEDAKKFADNRRYEYDLVKDRLQNGFRLAFPRKIGRRWRESIHETGLRSEKLGLPGRRFVAAARKGGLMRASWDKATLGVQAKSKLLSLDHPYVELNTEVLQCWRHDLDGAWPSVDAFRSQMRALVADGKLPHAPHLVAGDVFPDGSFVRPHLYFFLPDDGAVWNDPEDPRCRMDIVKLFVAVGHGQTAAMRSMAADPKAPILTQRGRCPLSPCWHAFTMEEDRYCSLSEWSGWVDTTLNRDILVRELAAEHAGLELKHSNEVFNLLQKEAYRLLAAWHFAGDGRASGCVGETADALHVSLEPKAREWAPALKDSQVALMVARVAGYAAESWDPTKLDRKRVCRGGLMHLVEGLTTVKERRQVAAEYASQTKAERTLERLVEAWDSLAVETDEPSKATLAREAGVSRTTVHARWADLQAVLVARKGCPVRCIDKKLSPNPAQPEVEEPTAQDRAGPIKQQAWAVEKPAHGGQTPFSDGQDTRRSAAAQCPIALTPLSVVPSPPHALHWPEDCLDVDDEDERLIAEQEAFLSLADNDAWLEDDGPPWREAA